MIATLPEAGKGRPAAIERPPRRPPLRVWSRSWLRHMKKTPGLTYIGRTDFRGSGVDFGVRQADRRHHLYILGKTGSGKSTLLRNMLVQDIEEGRGVGLIDPHGDLAEELLEHIPRRRTDDVVYFNPADLEHPIGWNLLADVAPDRRHLVASNVVSTFRHIWRESWGPRLEYVLTHSILALLEYGGSTLLGIPRLLSDESYRKHVVAHVRDPIVRAFWEDEFGRYDKRFLIEVVAPVQNKVGRLLSAAPLRNILGQVKSRVDLRFMMDDQRIFIANLGKGELGEENANLLGSLLVASFQVAALSRSDTAEAARSDFFLSVDEFHNFTTDAFSNILSEARKYRLCLTLAHQYVDQLEEGVRHAVFGNVGSLITFRLGNRDAEVLAREFHPTFTPADLVSLDKYRIYLRLMIDGSASRPFSAIALPPLGTRHGRSETIRRRSREKYARPRPEVESKIERWLGSERSRDTKKPPAY